MILGMLEKWDLNVSGGGREEEEGKKR